MIAEKMAGMLLFPYRVQNKATGEVIFESSFTFFDKPNYSPSVSAFLTSIRRDGWHKCPDGYAVYAREFPDGDGKLLVLHGLKVSGISTRQGREAGLSVKAEQSKIIGCVDAFIAAVEHAQQALQGAITTSIHEIRSVNAALYNCSLELQSKLSNTGPTEALSRNATALSELLSARITLIDATSGDFPLLGEERKIVPLYKKFDKLHRCFQAYSKARKVDLKMSGESRLAIRGDDLIELVPMLLIDNAVKYSPDKSVVSIDVTDQADSIRCVVTSIGPKLEDNEFDGIFLKGVRGRHARASGKEGSGIGLYFLRLLVEAHEGSVEVSQGAQKQMVKGIPYHEMKFILSFPAHISFSA